MKKLLQIGGALNCGAPGKIAEQIGLLAKINGWDVYMAHGLRYSNPSQLKLFHWLLLWKKKYMRHIVYC